MAIKKTIEIEIKDNVNVTTDHFEDLNDEIKAVKKQADDLSKSFESNGDAIEKSFKPLKAQFREAQQQVAELSEKFGATSKEAINAAKRAAELKDAIGDAKDLTDAFNPDAKFNALSNSIGGVLNGFQAFEGTLGLIGVESESVQQTLLKVQSAMALSQGLQGLMEAKDSFKQLGAVAADALKGIRTGIAATGIGLLVVALGTIYTYWDDIKSAISGVSEEQNNLNELSKANVISENHKKEILDKQDNILKLQGKTEEQILKLKVAQTNEQIKALEVAIKNDEITLKSQVAAEKRNKEILVGILNFVQAPLNLILKTIDKVGSLFGKNWNLKEQLVQWEASILFDPTEVEAEGKKSIQASKDALLELKNQRAGYLLNLKDLNKSEVNDNKTKNDEIIRQEKEKNDELLKLQIEAAQNKKRLENEALDSIEQATEDNFNRTLSDQEKEIQLVNDRYFNLIEKAKQFNLDTTELEIAQKNELNDINLKYAKEQSDLDNKIREEKKQKDKEATEGEIVLQQQKIQAVKDGFSTISNLAQLFAGQSEEQQKKAFKVQKAANISNTLIDTYSSATASYKSLAGIPIVGPVLGFAAAAAAVTAGLVNVRNIAQQEFNSSASRGGESTPSAPITTTQQAPSFNIVGNGNIGQLASLNQAPIQAYVVSGEVTSQQALDRNRLRNATF